MKATNKLWASLAVISYLVRVVGNMLYDESGNPAVYYLSDAIFEVIIVYCVYRLTRHINAYLAILQNMFLGLVLYFLFKVAFLNPYEYNPSEKWQLVIVGAFGAYECYRTWKKSKTSPKP